MNYSNFEHKGGGRVLGVDFGEKRVGIAVSDRNNKYALPLKILIRKNDAKVIIEILDIISQWGCDTVVIGIPDEFSPVHKKQVNRIKSFVKKIQLEVGDVNVVVWSESFTSKKAREANPDSDFIDDIAASVILESYLESITL